MMLKISMEHGRRLRLPSAAATHKHKQHTDVQLVLFQVLDNIFHNFLSLRTPTVKVEVPRILVAEKAALVVLLCGLWQRREMPPFSFAEPHLAWCGVGILGVEPGCGVCGGIPRMSGRWL
jgi:hypothetical protein